MIETIRLYHFLPDQFAILNLLHRRLKIAFSNEVNDLFEFKPFDFGHHTEYLAAWTRMVDAHSETQGFVSFSETWQVPTMWAHYADSHKGVCLGFDIPVKFAEKVEYVTALRDVDDRLTSDPAYREELAQYAKHHKSDHWRFEKEWRCWISLEQSEIARKRARTRNIFYVSFNEGLTLKEVILGYRSSVTQDAVERLTGKDTGVLIRSAVPSLRGFEMVS